MNKIANIILVCSVGLLTLSSCIQETFPESSTATSKQIAESASALDASMSGIPAQLSQGYLVYGDQVSELDMGYPGLIIAYNELSGDMFPLNNPNYDHFQAYNCNTNVGPTTYRSYVPWRTIYMFVKSANDIISAVKLVEEPSEIQAGYQGMAYAYRAWAYWLLWNMYYPVENQYVDVTSVAELTVPWVSDETAEADGKNNPRVTKEVLYGYIMADLDAAEAALTEFAPTSRLYPNLAVVYGLKARAYLSNLDYPNAATYARKAIDASGATPMTATEWHDPLSAFAKATPAWMWYITYSAESMGNLCNFTGWMGGEADWGYNQLTGYGINRWLYDRIPTGDFRKYSFIDPGKMDYYAYQTVRNEAWMAAAKPYTALKFRCVGGDWEKYATGGASDVALMRVEEMYLIEAEAIGVSQSVAAGAAALNAFMTSYRNASYACTATTLEAFQEEVIFQKRIELWGEGLSLFDMKRMKLGTKQAYEGTNAPGDSFKINAVGIKPAWNYTIPANEVQNNAALEDTNNPDPSNKIQPTL